MMLVTSGLSRARIQKAKEAKEEKQRKKEAKLVARRAEMEARKKSKEAEEGEMEAEREEQQTGPRVRRGRGIHEFLDEDPAVLKEKIAGHEITPTTNSDDFVKNIIGSGRPSLLRLSRSAVKKVLDIHAPLTSLNSKETNAVCSSFNAELEKFISDFAEKCEARLEGSK